MTALYYITAKTGSRQLSQCPILAQFPLFVLHCCKQFCTTKHSVVEPNPLCVMTVSFTKLEMFARNSTYAVYVMTTSNINCKYFTTFFNGRKGQREQFIIIGNKVGNTSFQKRSICL